MKKVEAATRNSELIAEELCTFPVQTVDCPVDISIHHCHFLQVADETITQIFVATTQYVHCGWITGHIYQTHRASFPALNMKRRRELVATDAVYSDLAAIDNGSDSAQIFVGLQNIMMSSACTIISIL